MRISSAIRARALHLPLPAAALLLSAAAHAALLAVFALLPAGGDDDTVTQQATVQFKLGRPVETADAPQAKTMPRVKETAVAKAQTDSATIGNHVRAMKRPVQLLRPIELPSEANDEPGAEVNQPVKTPAPQQATVDDIMDRLRAFAAVLPASRDSSGAAAQEQRAAPPPSPKPSRSASTSTARQASPESSAAPRGIDRGADIVDLPVPVYPRRSVRLGQQGTAIVAVHVLPSGAVDEVQLLQSSGHELLDEAALKAARSGRYTPAKAGGVAVEAVLEIPFAFRLRDGQR